AYVGLPDLGALGRDVVLVQWQSFPAHEVNPDFVGELRRAGLLPLLVLHFLGEGPSYGGRLIERVEDTTGGLVAPNPNTMYPLLRDLEARGLVVAEWEHPERRSRRFYRLTEAGEAEREELAAALRPRLDAVAAGIDGVRRELEL
ncbi:MAG: PadR family transcriptional regulator, partial [Actinomycetota bacterium]|nr:PadR family transcriptional regulator [Actinomycetota bacterium]